ncbi:MAG TPA: tetratricopeptide repeat protein [Nitrospirae bacterium]|nr:hypothetical protein BMS3Abin06_00793 [bacterium BMS3Abin06]HDH10762.1 tetratricopeptide repeat protein [Nitrospirota bacterium]HDZ03050.1 tetratricopeptide repeat protein [Nitrospirota bacterium]
MSFFKNFIIALLVLFSVITPCHADAGVEDYELFIAEGIQKINEGKFSEALGLLKEALKLSPDSSEAAYYAGIAYSNPGNYKGAEAKPYELSISAGGQYDSNVILETSNPPVGADRKSDARALVYITSGATLFKRGRAKLKADYNFYQSIHKHLNDFNVQYHKITPVLEIAASGIFKPSVGYSLEYTLLAGELYSRVHTSYGKVTVTEGEKLSTEVIYEYRDNKYRDSNKFQTNSIRSGYKNSAGIRQNFYLSRLSGDAYYFSDSERAKEGYWNFNGYRSGAELTCKITSPLYINVSGEYNERRYRDDYPVFQERRLDSMQQFSVKLTYIFSDRISASITDTYIVNNSNLSIFDYKRNITGIFFTAGIL